MRRISLTDRLAARIGNVTLFGRRVGDVTAEARRRTVPRHWTNLFGVVTLACIVVVTVTGLVLMFFYTPSSDATTYTGGYAPLHGAEVSKAFASTMGITFDLPGGLLLRQAHHWAALLLPASIIMQLLTTFFTGAFRRPRRAMWVLLFLIFVVSLAGGWSGYALPDDMLSGTGLRITEGIALGIPVVGTWLAYLLFGGSFPGEVIEHLYPLHVAVIPALLIALVAMRGLAGVAARAAAVPGPRAHRGAGRGRPAAARRGGPRRRAVRHRHRAAPARLRRGHGEPDLALRPGRLGRAPAPAASPTGTRASSTARCGWCRPGWEVVWLDRTWTLAILVPLAVVTVFLLLIAVYPFVEEWITGDRRDHHLLERPRNAPTRTAIGVAAVVFYGTLWVAGSADLIATAFQLTIEQVIAVLQATLVFGPLIGVLHRPPRVPGAAEEGPGGAAARLRDGTHRAPPRRRVRRGAPSGQRVRALAHRRGRRPSPAPAAPRRARADHRGGAAASAAVAVLLRGPHRGRVAAR